MAGDMDLSYALNRHSLKICQWIKIMVLRGDVNVVYIKQDSAIRLFHNFIQELPLLHLRYVKLGIAADMFYGNGNFKIILPSRRRHTSYENDRESRVPGRGNEKRQKNCFFTYYPVAEAFYYRHAKNTALTRL